MGRSFDVVRCFGRGVNHKLSVICIPGLKNSLSLCPGKKELQIWSDSWTLLKENSLATWIFGNGIGVFRTVYPKLYTPVAGGTIIFPHFHGLEILYDSGVIAVFLVFSGITSLLIYAIKAAKQAGNAKIRILVKCLIVAFIGWLIHTGFTLPFYSKYAQYSLAFILGTLLSMMEYPADRKDKRLNQILKYSLTAGIREILTLQRLSKKLFRYFLGRCRTSRFCSLAPRSR